MGDLCMYVMGNGVYDVHTRATNKKGIGRKFG